MEQVKRKTLLTRPLIIFLGAMILANIASGMHRPLLPLYLQSLGADIEQVGVFFTLSALAPMAFQILGGWLSDSLGRLKAVAIGSVAGVIGYVLIFVAPSWEWLLLATSAMAMASSFVAPSFQAFVAEQASEENLGKVYGLTEGVFMVVGIIGPLLGGLISDAYDFKMMFLLAAVLYSGATIIRLLMARGARSKPGERQEKPSLGGLKKSLGAMAGLLLSGGVITWIFLTDGIRDVTFNMSFQFEPIYMQDLMGLSNSQIGLLASISSVMTMLLMAPAGWLSDKRGERLGIVLGFGLIAAGLAAFILSRSFAGFSIAWVLFGMGQALISPAYNSLISKSIPSHLRGTAFGLFSTSISVISLPAPYIGAMLWDRWSPQLLFAVPMVTTLLLLPLMWIKFKRPNAPVESVPALAPPLASPPAVPVEASLEPAGAD